MFEKYDDVLIKKLRSLFYDINDIIKIVIININVRTKTSALLPNDKWIFRKHYIERTVLTRIKHLSVTFKNKSIIYLHTKN